MDNNFSEQMKTIIASGRDLAKELGNKSYRTQHFVMAIILNYNNKVVETLKSLNADLDEIYNLMDGYLREPARWETGEILELSQESEKAIRKSLLESKSLKSPLIESEHLFLAILSNEKDWTAKILTGLKIDYNTFRTKLTGEAMSKKKWYQF